MSPPMSGMERSATGRGASTEPALGKCTLAYTSASENLVTNDGNDKSDIFFVDTCAATVTPTLISASSTSKKSGNGRSFRPAVSANGLCIAFASEANDLLPTTEATIKDGVANLYLAKRTALDKTDWKLRLITKGYGAGDKIEAAGDASGEADIDDECTTVVFSSYAENLLPSTAPGFPDTNKKSDIYTYNVPNDRMARVTHGWKKDASGQYQQPDDDSFQPSISEKANFIAYASVATNLIEDGTDTNNTSDIFVTEAPATPTSPYSTAQRVSLDQKTTCPAGYCYQAELTTFTRYSDGARLVGSITPKAVGASTTTLSQSLMPAWRPSISEQGLLPFEKARVVFNTLSPNAALPASFISSFSFPPRSRTPNWETTDYDSIGVDLNGSPDVMVARIHSGGITIIPISVTAQLRINEFNPEALSVARDLTAKHGMNGGPTAAVDSASNETRDGKTLKNWEFYQLVDKTLGEALKGPRPSEDTCRRLGGETYSEMPGINPFVEGPPAWQRPSLRADYLAYHSKGGTMLLENYLATAFLCGITYNPQGKSTLIGNGFNSYGLYYGNATSEVEGPKALRSNGSLFRSAASNLDSANTLDPAQSYNEKAYCREEQDPKGPLKTIIKQRAERTLRFYDRGGLPALYFRASNNEKAKIDGFGLPADLLLPSTY